MARLRTLDQLKGLRKAVVAIRIALLRLRDVHIGTGSTISLSAKLRGPVKIGSYTYIAFKTTLDARNGAGGRSPIIVGNDCFVGGGSTLLPGTRIGDGCIVAAGAVVSGQVPPRSIVAGNPARVVREDVEVGRYGVLGMAADNARRLYKP